MIDVAHQVLQHPALSAALLLLLVQTPKAAIPFTTPLTTAEMANKQAVVTTTAGTVIIDLRPDLAPNHVGYFSGWRRPVCSTARRFTASCADS